MGKSDEALPLMVEGARGTVLVAVGNATDHSVAGSKFPNTFKMY